MSELHEFAGVNNQSVSELWDYYAFNPKDCTDCDVAQQCRDRIAIDFVDTKKRYFETVEDLDSGLNDKSVHVILLCNVLHEIDPREWLAEIQRFSRLLSDGGYLLIVEDQCLRDGETAHNYGFLVLDAPQLKILFGVPNEDAQIITAAHADEQYKDRLKAHLIPASLLPKVNSGTRASALKNLQKFAEGQAKRLRKSSCSLTNARRFAFWTQQHFNATCACNDFPL